MARNHPSRRGEPPGRRQENDDTPDPPRRPPPDPVGRGTPPPAVDPRPGATADAPTDSDRHPAREPRQPDAAEPSPQPHVVLGQTAPPESYDPETVAGQEVEARHSDARTRPSPGREQGLVRGELLEDPEARRAGPIRFGLVILAVVVVAALLLFLF